MELELPATEYEMLDLMEQLRLKPGQIPYLEILEFYDYEYLAGRIQELPDVFQLNTLAKRLAELEIHVFVPDDLKGGTGIAAGAQTGGDDVKDGPLELAVDVAQFGTLGIKLPAQLLPAPAGAVAPLAVVPDQHGGVAGVVDGADVLQPAGGV